MDKSSLTFKQLIDRVCHVVSLGVPRAEIIPLKPEPDNAGVGKRIQIWTSLLFLHPLIKYKNISTSKGEYTYEQIKWAKWNQTRSC